MEREASLHVPDADGPRSYDAGSGGTAHELCNLLGIVINFTALIGRQLEALERAPSKSGWRQLRDDIAEVRLAASRAAELLPAVSTGAHSKGGLGSTIAR